MIYTEMTVRAARIAEEAHRGQFDKGGMPYIFHPMHLAEQMTDEYTAAIALLHDVMEDTDISDEMLSAKFPPRVMAALRLLTHNENEDYLDYVRRIRGNPDAKAVKLADLRHNSDTGRLTDAAAAHSPKTAARLEKYRKAIQILTTDDREE
ncbi:MAG: bifunctional (p)ppGpp synthetase/guanosine-3',5'-bis(diphosphate) 3'-pyrophosphohydrolase [Oscillospiraceae bacterium]|nr:bifunctional (p)ppGpp synthetase/guanosine-3',5'-bis(diphosphate) 3'-pyrophosphohydrolase [Oscillospiraceae bacterium]